MMAGISRAARLPYQRAVGRAFSRLTLPSLAGRPPNRYCESHSQRPRSAAHCHRGIIAFVSKRNAAVCTDCGGIAAVDKAVASQECRVLCRTSTRVVVTPLHYRIEKMASLGAQPRGELPVSPLPTAQSYFACTGTTTSCPIISCSLRTAAISRGRNTPMTCGGRGPAARRGYSSGLPFPRALHLIDPGKRWTLLLQDWEGATVHRSGHGRVGRTVAARSSSLHNSYDCTVSNDHLAYFGIQPESCPGGTVLQVRPCRPTEASRLHRLGSVRTGLHRRRPADAGAGRRSCN